MSFWKENVDKILELNDKALLKTSGSISNAQMEQKVSEIYKQFDANRKAYDALMEDNREIEAIENSVKLRKR